MIESQDLNSGTSESLNLAKAILDPSLATKCGEKVGARKDEELATKQHDEVISSNLI